MRRLLTDALALTAVCLGFVVACGGEERLSREAFSQRLQSIDQRGGERYGVVAEQAAALQPGQPLSAEVTQPLKDLVEFQRQAVAELEAINPPEGAEKAIEMLIDGLLERSEIFGHAMQAGRFTASEFDQVTEAGEKIDDAFEQLRTAGFLEDTDDHQARECRPDVRRRCS